MEKTKKKQIRRYILWVLAAAAVAYLAAMPLLAQSEEEEEGPQASILSARVEQGSVNVAIQGGGILAAGEAMDVMLPGSVQITEFLAVNGQQVTQGTPVARVDKVSVMNTILQVKESMDQLQQQIDSARDDTVTGTIRATAGGRVKQVFAQPGEQVKDVMLRDGALAVLSLDGLMAARIECRTSLGAGDTVMVLTQSSGEVSGRVASNLDGILVVTVEDTGYPVGEIVELRTLEGKQLGTAQLYIHNAWKAIGYAGTVKTVYAKPETTLTKGASLFALTDTEYTGNLESLSTLHRKYADLLQRLFVMYETEVLTAPCDGIVSGVDTESPFLLSAEGQNWTILLLSESGGAACTGEDTTGENCQADTHVEGCYYFCTGTESCTAKQHTEGCYRDCTGLASCTARAGEHEITCLTWCVSASESNTCRALRHKADCIEHCEGATEVGKCPATGAHKAGCIESCISADSSKDCPATGTHRPECIERCDKTADCFATVHHYETCLSLCNEGEDCPALNHKESCYMTGLTYRAYAVRVRQVGLTELIVAADAQTVYTLSTGTQGWQLVEPTQLNTSLMITEYTVTVENPSLYQADDILLLWTGYSGETKVKTGIAVYSRSEAAAPDTGDNAGQAGGAGGMTGGLGGLGGGRGGFSSGGGGGGSQGQQAELFDLTEQVLLTVTDQNNMVLTITLDEKDITKAYPGQKAQVKITALRGRVFEAVVTGIGAEGTNNGGSSKFTLELTLPWQEDMLAGMHAAATIVLEVKENIPVLPAAALVETETGTVVYTGVDPETGELTGAVTVTTGVSDGENVQILTGLQPGDQVYYSYYDTLELDHTAKASSGLLG